MDYIDTITWPSEEGHAIVSICVSVGEETNFYLVVLCRLRCTNFRCKICHI